MDLNKMASQVTLLEGKKISLSIAQRKYFAAKEMWCEACLSGSAGLTQCA